MSALDLSPYVDVVAAADVPLPRRGRVVEVSGLVVRAVLEVARVGELVSLRDPAGASLLAEVVGFREGHALLMPFGETRGLGIRAEVEASGSPLSVGVGDALLGRVLDGLGQPMDGKRLPAHLKQWPVTRAPPDPLSRRRITKALSTGIRAVDGLLTVGEGQRIGLFAGSGVGKSTLLGQIARTSSADLNVVALVGERGREVREFVEDCLGPEGLARTVVVAATSDAPPVVRLQAAHVATAIAEWFADSGRSVLFLLDSITRFARARREVGLAAGEPPARQGYPPSVFAELPRLVERTGNRQRGGITAFYTVLVAGGDMEEPIADEVRGLLDGHVVLDRAIAARGRWPAIDVTASLSRLMNAIVSPAHAEAAARLRALVSAHERQRDLIALGAYARGSDPVVDEAIDRMPRIEAFLRQRSSERSDPVALVESLQAAVA
jgi:type III secretion protein N (ATPase)